MRASAALLSILLAGAAQAQTSPARGPAASPSAVAGDIPMDDYLGLLEQIAPAAHQGARTYLEAFERRCGRRLSAAELRRAVATEDGDPILMQMIRASHLSDTQALRRLATQVSCRPDAQP